MAEAKQLSRQGRPYHTAVGRVHGHDAKSPVIIGFSGEVECVNGYRAIVARYAQYDLDNSALKDKNIRALHFCGGSLQNLSCLKNCLVELQLNCTESMDLTGLKGLASLTLELVRKFDPDHIKGLRLTRLAMHDVVLGERCFNGTRLRLSIDGLTHLSLIAPQLPGDIDVSHLKTLEYLRLHDVDRSKTLYAPYATRDIDTNLKLLYK